MGKPSLKVDQGLVRKLSTYFIRRPANLFARVRRSTAQAIGTAAWTAVIFSHERWDTGINSDHASGFWVITLGEATKLTAPVSGNYIITGHIEWAGNAVGDRGIGIRHSRGAAQVYIAQHMTEALSTAEIPHPMSIATEYWLREDDYVELMVYQSSGGDLNINSTGNYSPEFTITRIP